MCAQRRNLRHFTSRFVLSPEQLRDTDAILSLNGCLRILSEYIHVFPWHVFIRSSRAICAKIQEIETACSLLDWRAIAFVPTNFGAWLTKGGRKNALDDFCYSLGAVVTRRGK
jgi:hypothetical protein